MILSKESFLKLKVQSYIRPHLMTWPLSGLKSAIFPGVQNGFFDVEDDVTQDDVLKIWDKIIVEPKILLPTKEWEVLGSNENKYIVKQKKGIYSCTCSGFGFRRKCKHIDNIKLKYGK